MHFSVLDWVIVIVYLTGSLIAGLYGKKYVSDVSGFLVAGRELGTYIGIATLAATEIGTVTFMYYAQLGYETGFASFINGLLAWIAMFFIGRTGFVIKQLRALNLMTVPEFMELRFNRRVRLLTGILSAAGGILTMGIFLKIEGTFLAVISGVSLHHLTAIMVSLLLLELVYTTLGGMISVVITDFIQFVALSVGTVLITLWVIRSVGFGNMYHAVQDTMGPGGFSPLISPGYGWAWIAFQLLQWVAVDICWQTTAMRTFSTQSPEVSRKVFTWSSFIFMGRGMMPMFWGIAALAMLGRGQDSLTAMPLMLARILPNGILGLVVAGMLAATMSVNSSYLLGWSAIIAQDIIQPLSKKPLSPQKQIVLNRVCNIFVSLFVMYWGLWYTLPVAAFFYLNMTATLFLAGTLACIVGGVFWKRASVLGAYCAFGGGILGYFAFFFLHISAPVAGLGSFVLAGAGLVFGSLGSTAKGSYRESVLSEKL